MHSIELSQSQDSTDNSTSLNGAQIWFLIKNYSI